MLFLPVEGGLLTQKQATKDEQKCFPLFSPPKHTLCVQALKIEISCFVSEALYLSPGPRVRVHKQVSLKRRPRKRTNKKLLLLLPFLMKSMNRVLDFNLLTFLESGCFFAMKTTSKTGDCLRFTLKLTPA